MATVHGRHQILHLEPDNECVMIVTVMDVKLTIRCQEYMRDLQIWPERDRGA